MTRTDAAAREDAVARFRVIGMYAPLAAFGAMALVQLLLMPVLPDPIAVHWGFTGGPDGFGPVWLPPLLTVVLGGGVSALLAGIVLAEIASPGKRAAHRFMAAVIWWEVGVLGAALFGATVMQAGLEDARDAPPAGFVLLGGLLLGFALGFIAWRLSLDAPAGGEEGGVPDHVAPADGEHAAWTQTVTMARTGLIVLGASIALLIVMTILSAAIDLSTGGLGAGFWITLGALVLVVVLVAGALVFRVRVDETGLSVRAAVGWPRIRIPRSDMRSVEVVQVSPMAEYGGWGWRYGIGIGWAVVMRAGEAVRITRRDGRSFTVTVDDAETAAALLRGMHDPSRAHGTEREDDSGGEDGAGAS